MDNKGHNLSISSSEHAKQLNNTDNQKVTIRDVAEKAGVSPAAVSLAFSGRGRIAEETRRHILAIAMSLNYAPPRRRHGTVDLRELTIHSGVGSHPHPNHVVAANRQMALLRDELDQRRQEGFDVTDLEAVIEELPDRKPALAELDSLWARMDSLPMRDDYPYLEVSSWEEIQQHRPAVLSLDTGFSLLRLQDQIYGGWLGRAIGCTLGRPLEIGGTYEEVASFLASGGAYPLDNYVPEILPHPPLYARLNPSIDHYFRGNIDGARRDDDLDYTVLNLLLLEKYGPDFSSEQLATLWLQLLTYDSTYTAERIAYTNLVNLYGPPDTAVHRNPYREFVGSQIRADAFGYICPGKPELAAHLAWRDARISHVKNGIYGEMMVSAMIAAAYVADDVETIIDVGLSVIPERSRMAVMVRDTVEQVRLSSDWTDAVSYITEQCAEYDPVHVLPNACIVVLALLWGKGDFETSITVAAMCGMDTDCNTATVGSITGVMNGASNLPPKWTEPINDRLESWVRGQCENRLSDLAQRTLTIARRVLQT